MLRQKLCDAATDALRLKLMESRGYAVCALELIDPEETPKNVLIRGVKRQTLSAGQNEKLKQEYGDICKLLGVRPYLAEHYHLL